MMGSFRKWKDLCHTGVEGCEEGRESEPLRPFLYIRHIYIILSG